MNTIATLAIVYQSAIRRLHKLERDAIDMSNAITLAKYEATAALDALKDYLQ